MNYVLHRGFDLVPSWQLSMELKKAGLNQECFFYWQQTEIGWHVVPAYGFDYTKEYCAAYTASELLAFLPHYIKAPRKTDYATYVYEKGGVRYECKTICNAIAGLLLHLIKNDFTTVQTCNDEYEQH